MKTLTIHVPDEVDISDVNGIAIDGSDSLIAAVCVVRVLEGFLRHGDASPAAPGDVTLTFTIPADEVAKIEAAYAIPWADMDGVTIQGSALGLVATLYDQFAQSKAAEVAS